MESLVDFGISLDLLIQGRSKMPHSPYIRCAFGRYSAEVRNQGWSPWMRSSGFSMPTEILTRLSGRPRAALTSAGIDAWLVKHGSNMSEVTFPKLTVILKSFACSTISLLASRLHIWHSFHLLHSGSKHGQDRLGRINGVPAHRLLLCSQDFMSSVCCIQKDISYDLLAAEEHSMQVAAEKLCLSRH